MARTNTTTGGGGGGGAWSSITGTPTEVAYFDLAGNGTSDSLFTRDSVTLATQIEASTGGGSAGSTYYVEQIGLDASTWDVLGNQWGIAADNDSLQRIKIYATGSTFEGSATFDLTGNTFLWDADTTDDIQDGFIQGNNLNGVGIKGNALAHSNTSTFESASFFAGDTTAVGGNPYEASMAYVLPGGINGGFGYQVNSDGLKAEYHDIVGNIKSNINQYSTGNTITWDANTGDTIITKLEQNEDILGLGGLAGSALTWSDSSTQIHAIIGAVDATAAGLFPGSTLIATNNIATGASASIATNYDDVLNVATVIANAGNGDFDSGFAFDDGRMIVRYKNGTTGFESAFESDINGAMSRYKLNTATDEYSTQLSNGVFQFFNSTTADQYMSLGGTTGIFQFGDISGASNDTKFIINDSAQIITNHVDGVFTVEDGAASSIAYIDAANRQSIFGNVSAAGGIKMFIDDSTGINIQAPGATINIGANGFGNDSTIQIDDTAETISVTKPFTLKGYTVATLPTGVVGQTAYVTDALAPAFGATVAGSGAVTIPVFFNGTNWIVG